MSPDKCNKLIERVEESGELGLSGFSRSNVAIASSPPRSRGRFRLKRTGRRCP
jgi:hypothetical protein